MGGSGELTIRTRVQLGTGGRNGLALTVSDNGPGMDAATRARLFEPFFTTKDEGRGTGLGLSTVRDIVEGAGGTIAVISELGQGTSFCLWFPSASTDLAHNPTPPPTVTARRCDLLLVDDDPLLSSLMVAVLESAGHRVRCVHSVERARAEIAKPQPIDLLISDEILDADGSAGSGSELIRWARERRPGIKTLLVTGATDLAIPGIDILPKPFSPDALANVVRRLTAEG
jgi:CheY-like chemotaxis protein